MKTKKVLWNDGWEFAKGEQGDYKAVNLPHDWLISQGKDLYETSLGWYRKRFSCEKEDDTRYEIYFEGVYMDTTVYLNGQVLGEWKYGYSSFYFDMTPLLVQGENELLVRVDYRSPNSRWYSGAGIYRDVWLRIQPQCHFVTDSLYITPQRVKGDEWRVGVSAQLAGEAPADAVLALEIRDAGGVLVASCIKEQAVTVQEPQLWSVDTPILYECTLRLQCGDALLDEVSQRFGFREFTFDTQQGFFLNGTHLKLNGVCEHHDLGALGAAFHREAMRRKLRILRTMGVNAIRSTHNMPAVGLLELADEMGFLVIDEAFDMWERPKTEYDYARFFKEWYQRDVKSWICRDRNHPCILFWSIGNEIYDTHADERGQEVTRLLMTEVRRYDPLCHAQITLGSNYMPWENAQKCADIVKYAGYNYGEKYYDAHHAAHPDWYIYGSETASTVQSRGIYHFPYRQSVLADDDEQCSGLGNSTTSWGAKSSEMCILTERDRPYSMGQFLWSGFDYIGEPTPYHTRNSYFGQIDTAGFPKDSYYIYRSAWTDADKAPFVHVFPYWDFNEGQLIDVRAATNLPYVELYVNGRSQGRQFIDHQNGTVLTGNWQVPYEKGEITAIAYDADGTEIVRESRHSFGGARRLVMELDEPDREYTAGNYDMAFITVYAVDEACHPVENAVNQVAFQVEGAGWLAGLDNGDSTDTDEYKGDARRLFSGKLLAMIAVGAENGEIRVTASSEGLESAELTIHVSRAKVTEGASLLPQEPIPTARQPLWARKIELSAADGQTFTPQCREMVVEAQIQPDNAAEPELIWKTVNDSGIDSPLASVTPLDAHRARVEAYGDGIFRLRCMTKNGTDKVKVISQLEFRVEGLGEANLNPYRLIAGGMYTYSEGEVGNGNEHGVSTARDGRTVVGFDHVDFGSFGSDRITLPVFELGGAPCPIEIWEGIPQSGELLAKVVYHKQSIWNTYQEETYTLSRRVKGVTMISFVLQQKIHLKGFYFTPLVKAYEQLAAAECDAIYGDTYTIEGSAVTGIGNNVTIEYTDMDFGEEGCSGVVICGRTHNDKDTIHISFSDGAQETRQMVEFQGTNQEVTYDLESVCGRRTVRLIFLPGSNFDLQWIRFIQGRK